MMKLCLVIAPGVEEDLSAFLSGGSIVEPVLVPRGFDRTAGLLALLGQDPRGTWTGPAPWGLATVRTDIAEDETAFLFTPVLVEDGVIIEGPVKMGSRRQMDMVEWFREELPSDPVQFFPGDPPLLIVAEPHVGPPSLRTAKLAGRSLSDLPAGPPAVLKRLVDVSQLVCLEIGGRATHFFPNTPGPASRVQPLKETWLGLKKAVVVGGTPEAYGLAHLLKISHIPAGAGDEIVEAQDAAEDYELVVVLTREPPGDVAEAFPRAMALAVAGRTQPDGRVPLIWLSRADQAVDEGVDLLKPLALGRGQSGRFRRPV